MKRKNKIPEQSSDSVEFLIPYATKRFIVGIMFFLSGFLLFLSIISYTPSDYSYIQDIKLKDFFLILDSNSYISHSATRVSNLLGLVGSIVSNAFVYDFLGYFSLSFVFVLMYWGLQIIRTTDKLNKIIFNSSLVISVGILLATFIGILATTIDFFAQNKHYYGELGYFLGNLTIRLIGSAGGLIIIFVLIFLFTSILIKLEPNELIRKLYLKIKSIFNFIYEQYKALLSRIPNKGESRKTKSPKDDRQSSKIKYVNDTKPTVIINPELEKNEKISIDVDKKDNGKSKPAKQEYQLDLNQQPTADTQKRNLAKSQGEGIQPWDDSIEFTQPHVDLLDEINNAINNINNRKNELDNKARQLLEKLKIFSIEIEKISITPGPVVTLFEVEPKPDVKINEITRLQDDLALALRAKAIRIIAPMPGKGTIGIEIPNNTPEKVTLRSVFESEKFIKSEFTLPIGLGKTISGEIFIEDLSMMPHLLIAGSTGSGKSVGINTIINSLLFKLHPSKVKFVLIDPKRIELSVYNRIKNHYLAVCPDVGSEIITKPDDVVIVFKSLELEMNKRYYWFSKLNARNIEEFNNRFDGNKVIEKDDEQLHKIPYIVVIVDELADLMLTVGKKIEESVTRLAQMSRAAGIHLIFATQRPSVQIISGNIKVNFPARIAYKVASRVDSNTILDQVGAEQLIGSGDMIFSMNDRTVRVQNAFIGLKEIERVLDFIEKQPIFSFPYMLPSVKETKNNAGENLSDMDDMLADAARLIVQSRAASVTFLQRRLRLGYARAARIMDELEALGVVGPLESGKNRAVLIDSVDQLEDILRNQGIL